MKRSVSVVLVTHNAERSVSTCLRCAIDALENSSLVSEYEIIIVDDCSDDFTVSVLKEEFPFVNLIKSDKRNYYTGSANKGINKSRNEIVVLLTQSVSLPKDYFDAALPLFDRDDTFAVSVQVKDKNESPLTFRKVPKFDGGYDVATEQDGKNGTSLSLSLTRGNMVLMREKIVIMGEFNMLFSPYPTSEDDLLLRSWGYNYKSYFTTVTHCHQIEDRFDDGGFPHKNENTLKEYNQILLNIMFLRGWNQKKYRIWTFFMFVLSMFLPLDIFKYTRSAYFMYLKNLGSVLNSRKWRYSHFDIDLKTLKRRYFE